MPDRRTDELPMFWDGTLNEDSTPVVLCRHSLLPVFKARQQERDSALISLDLGLTAVEVNLNKDGFLLPSGNLLSWEALVKIERHEDACFMVNPEGNLLKIALFSEEFQRACSLMPPLERLGAPTIVIAGFTMHRIKGTDPFKDTQEKVATLAPIRGRVLDTSTGLGYTAIAAAKSATEVVTIELDPTVLKIARLNPWSQLLFNNSKIKQLVGDSFDVVQELEKESFASILHDPPVFSLAGQLYSGAYYRELFRLLKRGGRLFHYTGDLESKSGHTTSRGVIRRLHEAGFARVTPRPAAFGVIALKGD